MKKYIIITALVILLVATAVQAHEDESDFNKFLGIDTEGLSQADTTQAEKDAVMQSLDSVEAKANEKLTDLPGIVKTIIGTTSANIYLEGGNVIGITIANGKISSMQGTALKDPTFNVHVSDTVFVYLNNNAFDMKSALKNKDITFEGVGFMGKMKSGMLKTALAFMGM